MSDKGKTLIAVYLNPCVFKATGMKMNFNASVQIISTAFFQFVEPCSDYHRHLNNELLRQ